LRRRGRILKKTYFPLLGPPQKERERLRPLLLGRRRSTPPAPTSSPAGKRKEGGSTIFFERKKKINGGEKKPIHLNRRQKGGGEKGKGKRGRPFPLHAWKTNQQGRMRPARPTTELRQGEKKKGKKGSRSLTSDRLRKGKRGAPERCKKKKKKSSPLSLPNRKGTEPQRKERGERARGSPVDYIERKRGEKRETTFFFAWNISEHPP